MEHFGFDDLLDEQDERLRKKEREWTYGRLESAQQDAATFFSILLNIRHRALSLITEWREQGVAYKNLHVFVGLAYMHACAEHRGGSVVFPLEVLNFANHFKPTSLSFKYNKVLSTYYEICDFLKLPKLLVHPESGIRRILASCVDISSPELIEQVVACALSYYETASADVHRPLNTKPPTIEVILGACVELSLRRFRVQGISIPGLRTAALQSPQSNAIQKWAKRLSEKLPEKFPHFKPVAGSHKKYRERHSSVAISIPTGEVVDSLQGLYDGI